MGEKPTRWNYITTAIIAVLCACWAFYEYKNDPGKIPFEPLIAFITGCFAIWGYSRWKKGKAEDNVSNQTAEKIYNIGEIQDANFGTSIKESQNVVSESSITATKVEIGNKNIGQQNNIETQIIQYAGDRKIPRALTAPPFLSEVFIGREQDLQTIHQKLFSDDNMLLLVNGQGGVGKTSIAARYYNRYQHEYAHTGWVLSERSIANALLTYLARPLGLSFAPTDTEAERLDTLLHALANLDKPSLLVIDNANDVEDLERNYLLLRRCSNFHLLLTSRIPAFEQAATHAISGLGLEDALTLFKRYYPKLQAAEEPLFEQIHQAVGGNTLVVEVLAKNLARFHGIRQQYSLPQLLNDLQTKGLLALTKSAAVKIGYQAKDTLRSETPEAIIAAMYDLSELSRAEVALLSVFAVLPAESIGFDWLEMLLPDTPDLETTALALAQRGWIEFDEASTSFKCNPVVQAIIRKKNETLLEDCEPLIGSLNKKLDRDIIHLDNYQQAATAAHYGENVLNNLKTPSNLLDILCNGMGYYFQQVGNLSKALSTYEIKCGLVEKLIAAHPENADLKNRLAKTFSWLGTTHTALGNLALALDFYEKDFELSKELSEAYPQNVDFKEGLAISYQYLGYMHTVLGNLPAALGCFEYYNKLKKILHEANPQNVEFKEGLAISYQFLGYTHTDLGNLPLALGYFEQYNQLEKELHEAYPQNVEFKNGLAISYQYLGNTHKALGNLPVALEYFGIDIELSKELHETYPQNVSFKKGLAVSYQYLGNTHTALGNLPVALKFFEQYNILVEKLHETYPQNVDFKKGLAISYEKLGTTHTALGNLPVALGYFEQYNALMKALHEAYPQNISFKNGMAISHETLGDIHMALGNLPLALGFFEQYNGLVKALHEAFPQNVEFKNGLAISYQHLGNTHTALGNLSVALGYFEKRCKLSKELHEDYPQNVEFKKGLAISYLKLGQFFRYKNNDATRARPYFQKCHDLYAELVRDFPDYHAFRKNYEWAKEALGK